MQSDTYLNKITTQFFFVSRDEVCKPNTENKFKENCSSSIGGSSTNTSRHECGKTFPTEGNLVRHKQIHSITLSWNNTSGKFFCSEYELLKRIGIHKVNQWLIYCNTCELRFSYQCCYKEHYLAQHKKEKRYKCSICHKGFSHRQSLYKHKKIHGKNTPHQFFSCPLCSYESSEKFHIKNHMKIMHAYTSLDE